MDRRTLLRGAGGVALGLPLLEAMIGSSKAYAQASMVPNRLIVLYQSQGVLMDSWLPTRNGSDYTFGPILDKLTPHKQDMVVITGVDDTSTSLDRVNAHERAPAHMLTGQKMLGATHLDGAGPSLDNVIADRISPANIPIKTLHLGANRPWEFSFSGPRAPIDRINLPTDAFNLVFGGFSGGGGGANQMEQQRQTSRKVTVLDAVKSNAASLRAKLGTQDKVTLDAYLQRISEIENRINAVPVPIGASCMPVAPMLHKSPYRTSNVPPTFHPFYDPDISSRAMMDLAVMALACDRTRVVTMAWDQPNVYDWLTDANNQMITADDWHQDYVHPGGGSVGAPSPQRDRLYRVFQYYHGEANYFLDKMKSTVETDGNLLDHSLVLYVNEFSNGSTHSHSGKPYWIAGKLNGAVQPGRWLEFNGVPHNRLLLSVLRAFGQSDDTFGDPQFCGDGPLTGLV